MSLRPPPPAERVPFRRKALAWFIAVLMIFSALTALALVFAK